MGRYTWDLRGERLKVSQGRLLGRADTLNEEKIVQGCMVFLEEENIEQGLEERRGQTQVKKEKDMPDRGWFKDLEAERIERVFVCSKQ